MKKILSLLLTLFVLLSCCGCGKKDDTSSQSNPGANTSVADNKGGDVSSEIDSTDEEDDIEGDSEDGTGYDYEGNGDVTFDNSGNTGKQKVAGSVSVNNPLVDYEMIDNEEPEEEETSAVEVIEKSVSTLSTNWTGDAVITSGKADAEATKLRNNILNAKNTAENYKIKGTTYYVSPTGNNNNDGKSPKKAFKNLNASFFRMNSLKPGDAVLFERGGVWRFNSLYQCKKGVTYGSYGKGNKPCFYGSARNYADSSSWIPSNVQNVWKLTVADPDIGNIVFDHGKMVGVKKLNGLVSLEKNGDYYYNTHQDTVYLYYDKGNPGKKFKDIEVGLKMPLFYVSVPDVTIDNLCLKYTGTFGVDLDRDCDNSVITNCEIGFVGGALQTGTTRYGNGIQCWNGVSKHTVKNNWVYQCYDTGITWQGDYENGKRDDVYENITYEDNLVEYCTMSFEFWHANDGATYISPATVRNFKMTNNISRFAGYGWGKQRPDSQGIHIKGWQHMYPTAKANEISGNIFDLCTTYAVDWRIQSGGNNGEWDIHGNTWYHGKTTDGQGLVYGSWTNASDLTSLISAVKIFDKNPAKVEWVS